MEILLLIVLFGGGIAYFASQNTVFVTVHLAHYVLPNIPLYSIVLASVFLGLFLGWIIHLAYTASWQISMFHKNRQMKETAIEADHLQERVRQLELENERLKGERDNLTLKQRLHLA